MSWLASSAIAGTCGYWCWRPATATGARTCRCRRTFEGGASLYRGGSGPLRVSYLRSHHPLVDTFVQAAQNAGEPVNPDYNAESLTGVCRSQVMIGERGADLVLASAQ